MLTLMSTLPLMLILLAGHPDPWFVSPEVSKRMLAVVASTPCGMSFCFSLKPKEKEIKQQLLVDSLSLVHITFKSALNELILIISFFGCAESWEAESFMPSICHFHPALDAIHRSCQLREYIEGREVKVKDKYIAGQRPAAETGIRECRHVRVNPVCICISAYRMVLRWEFHFWIL